MAGGDAAEVERRARALLASKDEWHRKQPTPRGLRNLWPQFSPVRALPVRQQPLDRANGFIRPVPPPAVAQ
jgi:hypothetical protein